MERARWAYSRRLVVLCGFAVLAVLGVGYSEIRDAGAATAVTTRALRSQGVLAWVDVLPPSHLPLAMTRPVDGGTVHLRRPVSTDTTIRVSSEYLDPVVPTTFVTVPAGAVQARFTVTVLEANAHAHLLFRVGRQMMLATIMTGRETG